MLGVIPFFGAYFGSNRIADAVVWLELVFGSKHVAYRLLVRVRMAVRTELYDVFVVTRRA